MAEIVMDEIVIKCSFDSDDAQKGVSGLSETLSKFKGAANIATKGTESYTASLSKISNKIKQVRNIFKKALDIGFSWFNESNDYVESLNLANVALGDCAESAKKYAEQVENIMRIDSKDWLTYQGSFYQLADGYGIAEDASQRMSKNLTQLSYDLSSLWNTDTDTAFQKLQSGMSGQIKGLKVWGINVSVAQLRETALAHGIDLATSKMTEAQKATLRYITIMEQTSKVQGDLARTITSPANALRILNTQWTVLKRTLGQVVSVVAVEFIPWVQALIEILKEGAQWLANFLGYELPDIDLSSITDNNTSSMDNYTDSLEEASDTAEKLKKSLLGIDEINALTDNSATSSSNVLGGGYASDFGLDLSQYDYGFLSNVEMPDLEPTKEKLRTILKIVGTIGVCFSSWKIAKTINEKLPVVLETLKKIKKFIKNNVFTLNFAVGGLSFLKDLNKLRKYIKDINDNGFNFVNTSGLISTAIKLIGDALIMLGNTKAGAGLVALGSVVGLVSSIADMSQNGVNFENVTTLIDNLSGLGMAIGLFTGNTKITGISMMIGGIADIINELAANNWDWSTVDKTTIATSVVYALFGFATTLGLFSKIKSKLPKANQTIPDVATATDTVSNTTSTLFPKLQNLAKNLGLGIVIIAEVAVAAGIIVGAIWGLGLMLEQVGIAWQPVLDNGVTVGAAMILGTAILVTIGIVTAALGTGGTALIGQMALGLAMLAILGVSTALFVAEIWAIGWGLDQIRIAWEPVLANGETIASAIGIGTGILVAIGVVTALLGAATAGTVGLLPLAIGLGTALLLELGAATLLFIAEIWAIGKGLDEVGIAWEPVLKNGDTISQGIEKGTALLIGIGVVTAALGVASVASVGLLPLAIALGTGLLIELGDSVVDFTSSLTKVADSMSNDLHPSLKRLNKKLPILSDNMESFTDYMGFFAGQVVTYSKSSAISGFTATVDAVIGFFTKDPIKSMADDVNNQYNQASGLNEKLKLANPELSVAIILMKKYYGYLEELERLTGETNNISLANGMFVSMKKVGENLVTGFVAGIKGKYSDLSVEVKKVFSETFTDSLANSYGENFGKKIGEGVVNGLKGTTFPELKGTINSATGKAFTLKFAAYATGGFPETGQAFVAREAGPELVGTIGRKTAVVNNDQIVESVSAGVADANSEQNALLREQNQLLRKMLEKETVVNATLSTGNLVSGIQRKNRRDGKVIVPAGV